METSLSLLTGPLLLFTGEQEGFRHAEQAHLAVPPGLTLKLRVSVVQVGPGFAALTSFHGSLATRSFIQEKKKIISPGEASTLAAPPWDLLKVLAAARRPPSISTTCRL